MNILNISRRKTLALALLAGVPAMGALAATDVPTRGGTLVIGSTQALRHVNGAVQSGIATAVPSTQIFASPLRFDDKWNAQPYLAEKWSLAADGKSLTLNLRKDAVFHDGKPVTSADVAFSIMAIKANHPFTTMMGPVDKVETPDAHTAIIRMSTPHPAIVLAMSPALCPILPKHIYGDGQRLVLERFDKFFLAGKPYLDKIIVNINPDSNSLLLGLERGEIQMIPYATNSTELKRVAANPALNLTNKGFDGIGAINWLAFNTAKKPLNDVNVRKAIALTIDKKFISKALHGGFSQPADGPIVAGSPFAIPDLITYPLDLKKAAEMLDAAGYKAGADGERFKLTIDYLPGQDEQQKNVAEYIRAQLKKVGVMVDVRASADFPSWAKRMATHDFDLSMDVVFNWGDPIIGVHRTYLSTNIRPIVWTNTQSYNNPKVDELLNTAGSLLEPTKRRAYYATFQKIVTDELPIHFINNTPYHTASSKKVMNVPTTIWGPASPFDEIYLK